MSALDCDPEKEDLGIFFGYCSKGIVEE